MPRKPRKPRWYFSLRSPYSWFAFRDLLERYPDVLADAEWIPYWEPDPAGEKALLDRDVRLPVVPMSKAKNLYILQDTKRTATARGWGMTWPVDRTPHWEVPHLAYLAAVDEGLGRAFVEAVYRARWTQGRNISDRQVIAEIAAQVGTDPVRAAGAADDPRLRERGLDCLVSAYRDDAFGVPYFVSGRDRFCGAERVPGWVDAVRAARAPEPVRDHSPVQPERIPALVGFTAATRSAAVVDHSHAGGCG